MFLLLVVLMAVVVGAAPPDGEAGSAQQQLESAELLERRTKVASDIACGMCVFVAEDLWASLVRDYAADSRRGKLARARGPHRTAREMLEQLCTEPSPIIPHFVDMYDIQRCGQQEREVEQACRGELGRQWFMRREGAPPPLPPPSAAALHKEINEDYQAALAEAIGTMLKRDTSLAKALASALGGQGIIDQDALSELMDAAMASDGELDAQERVELKALVNSALEKRAALRKVPPPQLPPPREKTSAEKKWHLTAYKDACAFHLRGVEVEFTEAIGEQFSAQRKALKELAELGAAQDKIEAVVSAGKANVSTSSCADICEGADSKLRNNKKGRKIATKQSEL